MTRRLPLLIIVMTLFGFCRFSLAGDVDDLKTAETQLIKAYMSRDAAAIASMVHPGAVSFESAFPTLAPEQDTVAQLTNHFKTRFGALEYLFLAPYNIQYKVVGNTGISWGHTTAYEKVKGERAQTSHQRVTFTWVKSGGKWLLLMAHMSSLPTGQ